MDSNRCCTAVDPLGQALSILAVGVSLEQGTEILCKLTAGRLSRTVGGAPGLACSGQLDPICWKPISYELQPDAIGSIIVVEHGE